MQVTDEKKRLKILSVAAEKFAALPFHKVLLSDVAAAAVVGKGTLYTYFKSKEELYLAVLYNGFSQLVDRLRDRMKKDSLGPAEDLDMVILEIVHFAYQNPHLFDVMRAVPGWEPADRTKWEAKRRELKSLIESIIRQGIAVGAVVDSNPELTSRYIPGLVRSALLGGMKNVDREVLTHHIQRFVRAALTGMKERS
jgi:AcrR family transcriptional regulator